MKLLQVRKLSTNTPDTHVQLNRDHVQETADAAMNHIQPAADRGHFTAPKHAVGLQGSPDVIR